MSWNFVRDALLVQAEIQLNAVGITSGQVTRISWPNMPFEPPTDNLTFNYPVWAAVHYMPNTPEAVTQGVNGLDEADGIMQIDINQPKATGDKEILSVLTPIENFFTAGRILTNNGQAVTITSCGRLPGRTVEDTYYRISLSIAWYARVTRTTL